MFVLLIHMYYSDSWEKIFRKPLVSLQSYSPIIMINLCKASHNSKIISTIKADFPQAFIIATPNKGKDIGGKLALIDLFIKTEQQSKYIVFLHDKRSPHSISGEGWRTKLLSIIDPLKIKVILKELDNNNDTGIIGAKDFIKSEFNDVKNTLETTNRQKIEELIKRYNLTVTNYTFVAGTMFWIKSKIVKKFFSKYSPLNCREVLEEGDFTDQYEGTYTHSWERLFCWLATDQHYNIKGI
jgi:lipopolysaccharide biosynthesis protein